MKLASEKGALFWKVGGILVKGSRLAATGKASDAVRTITSQLREWRGTGTTVWLLAGEIASKSPEPDASKAEAYFERALAVALSAMR